MKHPLLILPLLAACSSGDLATTPADDATAITFLPQTALTRAADDGYRPWAAQTDPATMSVWGHTEPEASKKQIFANQQVSYNTTNTKWEYTPLKYWSHYSADADAYDFFATMPYNTSATLTASGNAYTLSLPATIADFITTDESPLICAKPYRTATPGVLIPFQMDQTLTAYSIAFKIGTEMGKIRSFNVKSVRIHGTAPTAGTVSRTYTYSPTAAAWQAAPITWTGLAAAPAARDYTIPYRNNGSADYDDAAATMRVTAKGYNTWGPRLYAIPSQDFRPLLTVQYDAEVEDEQGNHVITRSDVQATIQLDNTNFPLVDNKAPQPGHNNVFQIEIIPDYLYVLADADQRSNAIVIATK